ncbi:non-ribosomal peptide synthetase [Streptomyces odontomachi]|uniref:non-ribosomal peptide synthetase n=1 Tax=Streptomyces odontomachi TaxID=2944940 RepID=UPI00210DE827|nr:non-ribosomal peptide synthetase [Streptomyces sp. ODS25]
MTSPTPAARSAADRFSALDSAQRVRLLRRLVESGRTDSVPAVVPPRDGAGPIRLSPAQQDLWVYESLYPGTQALNLCCAYHFDAGVDPEQLVAALTLLQDTHDVLRARIIAGADPADVRMEFPPSGPFALERVDLSGTGRTPREFFEEYRERPFDLAGGARLMRGCLVTGPGTRATLLLALHHIVTDWWSFDVLHSEFADAYRVVREGGAAPRRPAIQYADFACWQRELEESGVYDARLDFWQRYLGALPAPLAVPGATGAGEGFGIDQLPFRIDGATERAVRALARQHGTTVYGVLICAFAAFAARLTGSADLVLGTPTANRGAKGLDRVVGYVMNAVPTRWRIGPEDTFTTLIARFAAEFPQVLAHADVPVGRIVARTAPGRSAGQSPLFQWVFMYLPGRQGMRRLREFTEPERIHTGGEHDLVGIVQEADDGFTGTFEVRTDRYDPAVVRHWADGFTALLASLVDAPDTPATSHTPMTREQQRRQREESTGPAAPPPATLPGLLARQAARTPSAPALDDGVEVLGYGRLADRVARLAGRLAGLGAGPGRIVALALRRSAAAVVTTLAVQHTGAAHLPLDPDHPDDRLRRMLADAAPVLLVTEPDAAARYAPEGLAVLALDKAAYEADPLPAYPSAPGEAAYVLYTSGSTGRPKGVVVAHRGIAALAQTFAERFGLDATSRVLQAGSPVFDISLVETAMAFHSGATLVVPPPGPLAGEALGEALGRLRITAALLPPALLAGVAADRCPELRTLGVGAEACPPGLPARWTADGRQMFNAYGPTEATVGATVSDPLPGDGTPPPIGRPVAGTRVHVLDAALRPVPVGVRGELYLAGDGLALGYLGQLSRTAERFVPDPYGPPGARMYRTGDLARRRPDGQLDFLGRADTQLKVNGLRVEPGEIEAVLAGHPALERAVVTLREDVPGERRLVAYGVPRAGRAVDAAELRAHATALLPAALVPVAYVALDAVPLLPSGKTDRAALPAPRTPAPSGSAAPGSPREAVLCTLFAGVLGRDEVGVDGDFFELGGDSIMAIQLVARARAAGLEFAPAEVFTARTPAQLAATAREAAGELDGAADDGVGPVPLTPIMHWWRAQGGTVDGFTMPVLLRTPAGTDEAGVAAALGTLLARHGALRMRVSRDGTTGRLDALDVPPPDRAVTTGLLTRVDAAGLDGPAVRAAARERAATLPLDVEAGQTVRAVWYDAGPGRDGRLLLCPHHLAVDGVSLRILGTELGELLAGRTLPGAPRTSVRRWSGLLHEAAREPGRRAAELPWWEATLRSPEARLTAGPPAGRRATVTMELPPSRTRPLLDALPAAFHCGPDAVLLTALAAAVARWRGTGPGLLVDVEGHGRDLAEPAAGADVSGTVGWFTSQYPVLLDAGGSDAFWAGGAAAEEALKQVKEQLRSVPSGGLGWGLLRWLDPESATRLAPLPQPDLRFNYLGRLGQDTAADGPGPGLELLGADADALPLAHTVELDVLAEERADGPWLSAVLSYADGSLGAAEVRRLAGLWDDALTVLATLADVPDAGGYTASDFPLVDLTQDQLDLLQGDDL